MRAAWNPPVCFHVPQSQCRNSYNNLQYPTWSDPMSSVTLYPLHTPCFSISSPTAMLEALRTCQVYSHSGLCTCSSLCLEHSCHRYITVAQTLTFFKSLLSRFFQWKYPVPLATYLTTPEHSLPSPSVYFSSIDRIPYNLLYSFLSF